MTDTPLVPLTAAQAATARANGHVVYSLPAQEYSTADWATSSTPTQVIPPLPTAVPGWSITNTNLPDFTKNLDFQAQWLGNGTPTTPCPFDIAWAQQYSLA
jgi:hypothetical protein